MASTEGWRADECLNAEGALPAVRPAAFDLWPLQAKLFLAGDGGCTGGVWLSDPAGVPGGILYRLIAHWPDWRGWRGVVAPYRP